MIHVDPTHIAPDPAPADASARALIEGQMAMLSQLAEIGMEIAEACGREAKAAPNADDARAVGLVFARVARAVRMTIALQSRLMKDLAALDRADEMAKAARTTKRRIRLRRLVEQAAEAAVAAQADRQGWDEDDIEDEIEHLASEAYERLTDAEDEDLSGLSLSEAVAGVCKDLGLPGDWMERLLAASTSPTPSAAGGPLASQAAPGGGGLGAGPPPAIAAATGEVGAPPRAPP